MLIATLALSACTQASTAKSLPNQSLQPTPVPTKSDTAALIEIEVLPTDSPIPSPTTPTQTPVSPSEPIGGIELHAITDQGGLSLLRDTNTHWIRYNGLFWADVEPNEGERNWDAFANLKSELQTASEQGYEVILIVRNSPTWARTIPDYHCSPIKPEKLNAFASFMYDVVTKYSAPPYNVKYWEMGNEPDVDHKLIPPTMPFGCWGDDQDEYYGGGYYAEMLKAVYPQVKISGPQCASFGWWLTPDL